MKSTHKILLIIAVLGIALFIIYRKSKTETEESKQTEESEQTEGKDRNEISKHLPIKNTGNTTNTTTNTTTNPITNKVKPRR